MSTSPIHRVNLTSRFFWRVQKWSALVISLTALSTGCGDSQRDASRQNPDPTTASTSESNPQAVVVADFADRVVIPTYQELVAKAEELSQAIDTFVNNPTQESLESAQQTWIATRVPWEQSEAFAFGPADALGFDGDLDDWPVNETDVQALLNSSDQLTPEYVKQLQTTQKGFHTIELLLFGTDNNKQASDFSERELQYLNVLAVAFNQTANDLVESWVNGVEGNPPYREVLATAGDSSNSAYPSVEAAVEEIVQGMIGCLDEVANEKIGEPLATEETEGLESRFSQTSLNDFQNNLLSVRNAYLGSLSESGSDQSLSSLVAQADPQLDQQVKQELETAIEAVNAIPKPIEQNINDQQALSQMEAAQQEILTLFSTIEEDVLPLVQG